MSSLRHESLAPTASPARSRRGLRRFQGGLDEAGRGSVLGPLVVAGVAIDPPDLEALLEAGLKDSKLLTRARRESLAPEIRARARAVEVVVISPAAIDRRPPDGGLDLLEADAMASIIRALAVDRVVVDAPGPGGVLFGRRLRERLPLHPGSVSAENKADLHHPIVAAASVVAKTVRDEAIVRLAAQQGEIGSGYPSDPKTIRFLERWASEHPEPPPFARHSWATIRRIFDHPE